MAARENRQVLKSIIIASILSIIQVIDSQGQSTKTVFPFNRSWETGYVTSTYNKYDDNIWVGKPTIGYPCRGFIYFDVTSIPSNAIIQSIKLKLFPFNPAGSNHNLKIHQMRLPDVFTRSNEFGGRYC